ncbi:peptidylprolyl isomerase [Erythrobacter oryzae]|uniref:peptidylprolyl isomerase n=1 Tax=Erythrobacter oryzae TaxID=3019556 RepID=UPI002553DFBF|nr:peptidylprolyl isomerase [Erythrobacter sp. COR-2]
MRTALLAASAALALTLPLSAEEAAKPAALAPSEIVAAAPKSDWKAIPAEDLLVMTLAPDADGKPRTVVIQLMPAPFSQGWIHNIRLFARAKWYDGISVNRVQDNYVTQWGDPNYDNPEATGKPKSLPKGLKVMTEAEYIAGVEHIMLVGGDRYPVSHEPHIDHLNRDDAFASATGFVSGWPVGVQLDRGRFSKRDLRKDPQLEVRSAWPTHCYGMVGVGRNYSPDTGSGAELYTVIGHAPRHLDRNIALVGRVIEGMHHLSSLPRGSGDLGFYTAEEAAKRTPILTVRVASDLPAGEQPRFEYLSTDSATFDRYAEAIANRRDPFFIVPAGRADICNVKVPVRRVAQ